MRIVKYLAHGAVHTIVLSVGVGISSAQSLMETAGRAQQQAKERKRLETLHYDSILNSRDLSAYRRFVSEYPEGKNSAEIKRRIAEIETWDSIKSMNSKEGFDEYLANTAYHWFDADAENGILLLRKADEKDVWTKIATIDLLPIYQLYLEENPDTAYKREAEEAILRLKGNSTLSNTDK